MCILLLVFITLPAIVNCVVFDEITSTLTLPESIYEFCPYFTDCYSKEAPLTTVPEGYKPCCKQCSCRPDCGHTNNCCRDDLDETNTTLLNQICTLPVVGLEPNIAYHSLNFLMIHDCPRVSGLGCKEATASPWGPMYPVTSLSTKQTYLNRMCAACHNVSDVIAWDVSFVCTSRRYNDANEPVIEKLKNFLANRDECKIQFIPSANISDIPVVCNPSTIQSCNVSGLMTNVSSDFQELCESFNSTFSPMITGASKMVFANVYCFLCNFEHAIFHECLSEDEDQKSFTENSFVSLMKVDFLPWFFNSELGKTIDNAILEPSVCGLLGDTENECRPVLCPAGRACMDKTGCSFFSKAWYSDLFTLIIKLVYARSDEQRINVSCFNSQYQNNANHLITLSIPGLNGWKTNLYYHPVPGLAVVEYFVVKITLIETTMIPEVSIDYIKGIMAQIWTIETCNYVFNFKAVFNEHVSYYGRQAVHIPNHLCIIDAYIPVWSLHDEHNENPYTEFLVDTSIQNEVINVKKGLVLTSSFFCDQVTLRWKEYTDLPSKLYVKKLGMFLGDGQFIKVIQPDGNSVIRVCLETVSANRATCSWQEDVMWTIINVVVSFLTTLIMINEYC